MFLKGKQQGGRYPRSPGQHCDVMPPKGQPKKQRSKPFRGWSLIPVLERFDDPTGRIVGGRCTGEFKMGTLEQHVLAIEKGVKVLINLINQCSTSEIVNKYSKVKLSSCLSKIMDVKEKIERLLSKGGIVKRNSREMCTQTSFEEIYDKLEIGVNMVDLPQLLLDKWPSGAYRYTKEKYGNIFDEKDVNLIIVLDLAERLDSDFVLEIKSRIPQLENLIKNGVFQGGKVATSLRKGASQGNSRKGIYIVAVDSEKGDLCMAKDLIDGVGTVEGMGMTEGVIYGSTTVETGDLLKKLVEYKRRRSEDDVPSIIYTGRTPVENNECVSCCFKNAFQNKSVAVEATDEQNPELCVKEIDLNEVLSSDWPRGEFLYTIERTGSIFEEQDARLVIALDLLGNLNSDIVRTIKSRIPQLDYLIASGELKSGKVASVMKKEAAGDFAKGELYVIAVNTADDDLSVAKDLINGIRKVNDIGVTRNVIYGSTTVKLGELFKKIVEYLSRCNKNSLRLNVMYTGRKPSEPWFKSLITATVTSSEKDANESTQEKLKESNEINKKLENGVEENELPELLLQDWPSECFRYVQERKGNIMEEVDADLAIVLDMGNDVDSAVGREVKKKMPNLEEIIESGILEGGKILSVVRDETDKRGMHVITVDSKKGDLTVVKDLSIGLDTVKNMAASNCVIYGACSVKMGDFLKKLVEYQSRREGLTEGVLRLIYIDRIEPGRTTPEDLPFWDDTFDVDNFVEECANAVQTPLNVQDKKKGRVVTGIKKHNVKKKVVNHLCHICGDYVTNLQRHLMLHLGLKPYSCSICKRSFRIKKTLDDHMSVHTGEKLFVCEACGRRFSRKSKLKNHYDIMHAGIKRFECEICKKRFGQFASLRAHRLTHTEALPFVCPDCNDRFIDDEGLQRHMLRHKEGAADYLIPKPPRQQQQKSRTGYRLICDLCGKTFKDRFRLKDHLHRHAGERQFCKLCDKSFVSMMGLNTHMQMHNGKYECNICGRRFGCRASLDDHVRRHKGEKPYRCEVCGRGFAAQTCLRRHGFVHLEEKNHVCPICGKAFSNSRYLNTHKKRHTSVKKSCTFSCSFCEKQFASSRYLKKHLLKHSTNE